MGFSETSSLPTIRGGGDREAALPYTGSFFRHRIRGLNKPSYIPPTSFPILRATPSEVFHIFCSDVRHSGGKQQADGDLLRINPSIRLHTHVPSLAVLLLPFFRLPLTTISSLHRTSFTFIDPEILSIVVL